MSNKGKHYNIGIQHSNYKDGRSMKKYYCSICNKEINWQTGIKGDGHCQSCARKILLSNPKNHPLYGKHHSEKTLEKLRNRIISEETKMLISKHHKDVRGENNPTWRGGYPKCIDCGKPLKSRRNKGRCLKCYCKSGHGSGRKLTLEQKKICSLAKIGSKNPMYGVSGKQSPTYGRIMPIPKKVQYKNVWMRSRWESAYAEYLDKNGIDWQYEKMTFKMPDCSYTPDFYLPKKDTYIEVKGYLTDYAKNKIDTFKKYYPTVKYQMVSEKELKALGVLN